MPDVVPPKETPADRGHHSVENVTTASGASQAINREIGQHVGDTKGNKEFLQAASADLQKNGLLPEMAVDFGKKHFKEYDTDKDGYCSEAEIRRGLQKNQDSLTPAERLAGNYLADKVADPNSGLTYWKGLMTEDRLNQYGKDTATKYDEYKNAQAVLAAFGSSKDFSALDADKGGSISADEMRQKLAYNERRLSEDDISQKTKDKFEKENKALKYMLDHQGEMNNGSGYWGSDLNLKSMKQYAADHKNPGVTEGTYGVTADMVRGSAEVEAKAAAEAKAISDAKAVAAAAEAKAKADAAASAKAKADADAAAKAKEAETPKDEGKATKDKPSDDTPWPDLKPGKKFKEKFGIPDLTEEPKVCKPGDPSCHIGPPPENEAPQKPKLETPGQEQTKKEEKSEKSDKEEKQPEKQEKQEQPKPPEKVEKPLTELEKLAVKAGASTLETAGAAYKDAAEKGKGVAVMIVGKDTPGSQELLAKLPELIRQNPNLNFVVIDKDKVNSSADPAMASWKSWVNQSQSSYNHAFTSVQSIKRDANGNAMPDRVTSTHWGAQNIEAGLQDQGRYAADGTRRNLQQPPADTTKPASPIKVPEAPSPDEQVKKTEHQQKPNNDKPSDRPNNRPREVQYARSQADIDAAIKANDELGLPTIIDVTRSHGCGNCDSQNPVMAKLAKEFPGQIIKVDADSQLGRSNSIPGSTLPNIFVRSQGQNRSMQGFQREDVIRRALQGK
ncbi:MAG: hypothetical protein JST89_25785 [Cyanobacteria bacterium SZAS-4]|nr:hypothetical protein [Cyanobacteria bacterium SZAS-4]